MQISKFSHCKPVFMVFLRYMDNYINLISVSNNKKAMKTVRRLLFALHLKLSCRELYVKQWPFIAFIIITNFIYLF